MSQYMDNLKRIKRMLIAKRQKRKIRKDCRCDCGHTKEQHYGQEGQCRYCGCTWFYPCIARVKKNQLKQKRKG